MNKILLIFLGVILVGGGIYFLGGQRDVEVVDYVGDAQQMEKEDSTSSAKGSESGGAMMGEMDLINKVMGDDNTLIASLEDVSGGSSTGTGYVLRDDEMLYHYVFAGLPEPNGDNVYEGWLVRQEPRLEFFSTGVMTPVEGGGYSLYYTNSNTYPGYDFVVITEETVVDEIPETHILEGTTQ